MRITGTAMPHDVWSFFRVSGWTIDERSGRFARRALAAAADRRRQRDAVHRSTPRPIVTL